MVNMTKYLQTAPASAIGQKVVMTSGAVAFSVPGFAVIHFAVASGGRALNSNTAILRPSLSSRTCKAPDMFSLPCPATFFGAPSATTSSVKGLIAPLASSEFALPHRKWTGNSFHDQRRDVFAHLPKNIHAPETLGRHSRNFDVVMSCTVW